MKKNDHTALHLVIKQRQNELRRYIGLGNANPIRVEIENDLIKNLIEIYNYFERMRYFEFWLGIEQQIIEIEALDENITGHIIYIRRKKRGKNYSQFNTELF